MLLRELRGRAWDPRRHMKVSWRRKGRNWTLEGCGADQAKEEKHSRQGSL